MDRDKIAEQSHDITAISRFYSKRGIAILGFRTLKWTQYYVTAKKKLTTLIIFAACENQNLNKSRLYIYKNISQLVEYFNSHFGGGYQFS